MNRTYTPGLAPDVLDRLAEYAANFRDDFNRPRQAQWCGVQLHGLLQDGDRKSVEPMAARVPLPEGLGVSDPDQALQQFLGQSTWDERAVLERHPAAMARMFTDPARLDKSGVPDGERRPLTKGEIALELLGLGRDEGLPGRVVAADSGYGISGPFRDGLAERGLRYVVGVTDDMVVFAEEPTWEPPGPAGTGGRGAGLAWPRIRPGR